MCHHLLAKRYPVFLITCPIALYAALALDLAVKFCFLLLEVAKFL